VAFTWEAVEQAALKYHHVAKAKRFDLQQLNAVGT
jgi:hypothetical protein